MTTKKYEITGSVLSPSIPTTGLTNSEDVNKLNNIKKLLLTMKGLRYGNDIDEMKSALVILNDKTPHIDKLGRFDYLYENVYMQVKNSEVIIYSYMIWNDAIIVDEKISSIENPVGVSSTAGVIPPMINDTDDSVPQEGL